MSNDRIPSEESLSAEQLPDFDHEEQDEQTWLDDLRRFQHSLLQLQSKKIIASEIARER